MSSDSSLRGYSLAFSVALCVLSFSLGFLLARGGLLSASGSEGNTQERMGVESTAGDRAQPSWEQEPTEGDLVAEEPSSKGTDFVELLQLAGRVAALQATLDELDPVASDWPEEPPQASS
ncbi:MAG TPA: hypothetical protein DIU15_13015 [Deltaproteobacteria bacterium]|nr:hypothetical protein [Deltaproteobacteria bacterium]HCP46960.1 hypothetical protein [Deltaproteobacteria bacterium]